MRGVWWFLVLAFGLSWGWWELVIRSGIPVLSWQFSLYAIPGGFGPAIAATIVRKWITREGFADAGLPLRIRDWRYYLFAWLLPVGIVAAIVAQSLLLGITKPDSSLAAAEAAGVAGRSTTGLSRLGLLIVPQLMVVAIFATPLLWGEEFGWRGYLQPRIFADRPVAAALATGIIWAVWHFPLTLRGYNYPDHPVLGSLLFIPLCVLLAYVFGWLRRRTGSIWSSSLAHSATNSIGGLPTLWFAGAASTLVTSYGGLLAIGPLFLVCLILWFGDRKNEPPASS
jgi:membrane protease YdiL (CAAX protease family)